MEIWLSVIWKYHHQSDGNMIIRQMEIQWPVRCKYDYQSDVNVIISQKEICLSVRWKHDYQSDGKLMISQMEIQSPVRWKNDFQTDGNMMKTDGNLEKETLQIFYWCSLLSALCFCGQLSGMPSLYLDGQNKYKTSHKTSDRVSDGKIRSSQYSIFVAFLSLLLRPSKSQVSICFVE